MSLPRQLSLKFTDTNTPLKMKRLSVPTRIRVVFALVFILSFLNMFVPLIMGYDYSEDTSPYLKKLSGLEFKGTLIASIAATLPLLYDFILDIFYFIPEDSSISGYIPHRELFVIVTFANMLILLVLLPLKLYAVLAALIYARDSLLIACFIKYIHILAPNVFTFRSMVFILCSFIIGNVFRTINFSSSDENQMKYLDYVSYAVIGAGLLELSRINWNWAVIYRQYTSENIPSHVYICHIYVCVFKIFIIIDWAFMTISHALPSLDDWSTLGVHYLSLYSVCILICTVVTTVLTSRLVRQEHQFVSQNLGARKSFMRYISHEIRTPLNIVMAGLKVLEEDLHRKATEEELYETILDIRSSCAIAVDTLSEMLTYDKVESNSMTLDKTEFSVHDFVSECLRPFYLQATAAGITMDVTFDRDTEISEFFICADEHKLSQVLRNLVSNALKFTPKDGHVNIYVKHEAGNVKIEVVDTGAGIAKDNQGKLFKSIVQFNPGKLQSGGGTGLGLFISKGIVDLHDGDLTVFSAGEGTGTTFTLKVPLNYSNDVQKSSGRDKKPSVSISVSMAKQDEVHMELAKKFRTGCTVGRKVRRFKQSIKYLITGEGGRVGVDGGEDDVDCAGDTLKSLSLHSKPSEKDGTPVNLSPHKFNRLSLNKITLRESTPTPMSCDDSLSSLKDEAAERQFKGHCKSVLLVDDSEANRKMLNRLLRIRCDVVETADDGAVAVGKVKSLLESDASAVYDVVLMDNHMVNMDGPAAAQEMRKLGFNGLIIGLTGDAAEEDVKDFMSHGADYVLTKPLDVNKYDEIIKKHID